MMQLEPPKNKISVLAHIASSEAAIEENKPAPPTGVLRTVTRRRGGRPDEHSNVARS